MKTRRKNSDSMLLRDWQFSLTLLATIIIVACVALVVSRAQNWIPVAVIVGIAAGLFTLIAYKVRKGRDDQDDSGRR